MKDFFFYTTPTSPHSSSSSFHHHSSFFDYYDDPAVLDGVPLLSHHHGPLSCSETINFDHINHSNEDERVKDDFEFDFSGQLRPSLSSADELFYGGKIRPLMMKAKPTDIADRQTGSEDDEQQYRVEPPGCINRCRNPNDDNTGFQNRGRGEARAATNQNASTSNKRRGSSARKGSISRSLSPLRVSEFALFQRQHQHQQQQLSSSSSSSASCSRKWRLKDLFLFRSASEGHYKDSQSYAKRWSFRSLTMSSRSGSGSGSGSESKRKGGVQASAHEMHYTSKRAVTEEMKKKTSLPYKHNGLLACLGCSPILPQFSY